MCEVDSWLLSRPRSALLSAIAVTALLSSGWATQAADIVLQWNIYARETIKRDSANPNPGWSTRALAMMNAGIYDCFQAIHRTHTPFHVDLTASPTASRAAAASEVSYRILKELYAGESSWLLWAYSHNLSLIPDGVAKTDGVALGMAVAERYLSWRAVDGAGNSEAYTPSGQPGQWRPDPLNPTQTAWGPAWGSVETFALETSTQFPVVPPPTMASAEYLSAWNEVRDYGSRVSAVRTADQLAVGLFWAYDRSGLGPPPVLYSKNVHEIAMQRGNTEVQNARLFAMACVAMADAATAAWDAKFRDNVWRPITGIREADTDDNPDTAAVPGWTPRGCPGGDIVPDFTPPFPAYPSGHATMGEAVFAAIEAFYGTSEMTFDLTSDELPGQSRHYTSLHQAAQENADSRVWLGVHWRFDQTEGQRLGRAITGYVASEFFRPVATQGEDLTWTIAGPTAVTGYSPIIQPGNYTINGRFEVAVTGDYLRLLTSSERFTILTTMGSLAGAPLNVSDGRLVTTEGFGSFRVTFEEHSVVLDDFQRTPGLVESFADFATTHALSGNPEDDADGDGYADFFEYAFATQPRAIDQPPAAVVEVLDGQKVLVLRYLRRPGRLLAGLNMEAQRSEELEYWNAAGMTDEIDPEAAPIAGAEPRRAWVVVPETGALFLRLWARLE